MSPLDQAAIKQLLKYYAHEHFDQGW